MSDRTRVRLTVREVDWQENRPLFEGGDYLQNYDGVVILDYYDVSGACLDFEATLQEKRIPYDKEWDAFVESPAGSEHFRVFCDGEVKVITLSQQGVSTITPDDAIAAYKRGEIASFLESKKNEQLIMDWDFQDLVLNDRLKAYEHLSGLSPDELNALLLSFVNTDKNLSPEKSNELGASIMVKDLEGKITYLLNKGFLPASVTPRIFKPYSME